MHLYKVGEPYSLTRTRWPQMVDYNHRLGHEMRMFVPDLSLSDVAAIAQGRLDLALVEEGPILFLLYRFAGFGPWSDAPYNWHLTREALPEEASLPAPDANLLTVLLVEANTGILKAIRAVGMDLEFARTLNAAIERQALAPWIGGAAYQAKIDAAYRRYSTSEAMLPRAIARMTSQP